jgi:hypothetical protein
VLLALSGVLATSTAGADPSLPYAPAALSPGSMVVEDEARRPTCPIVLIGATDAAWTRAVESLEARTNAHGSDCDRIELVVTRSEATLTYVTRDGRSAARTLRGPSELEPTVLALGVTTPDVDGPDSSGGDTDVRTRPRDVSPSPQDGVPPKDRPQLKLAALQTPKDDLADAGTEAPPSSLPPDSNVLFGFGTGFRSGTRLISPLITGTAALAIGKWELGVQGRWEAHYAYISEEHDDSGTEPPGTAGLGAGVTAGRRQPIGNTLLVGGIMLNVTSLHDGTDEEDPGETEADRKAREERNGRAEARAGVYTGFVFPRRSSVRFRSDVSAEIVPHSIGASETGPDGIPLMPWWAVGFTLGMEFGAP